MLDMECIDMQMRMLLVGVRGGVHSYVNEDAVGLC